jgi:hypothetical protein
MSDAVGRAGFDVSHMRHGVQGNSDRRARTLRESMRELGSAQTLAYLVKHNPNIVESLTPTNLAYVNNGSGGFKRAGSVAEVLSYGDARAEKVFRKIRADSYTTTTMVLHLPKSMCEAVHYTRSDGMYRTRWVAKDRSEMLRYFDVALHQLSTKVLTGGHDAIHGYDLNLDETTPHIQVMADTFEEDSKHEGKLRVAASKMWGSHPDVVTTDGHQETRFQKMRRYQKEFRERMVSAGFDVEIDAHPVRSDRKESKADYVELMEREEAAELKSVKADEELTHVQEQAAELNAHAARQRKSKDAFRAWSIEMNAHLEERAKALDAREQQLPELRRKALREGKDQAVAEARAEMDAQLASERAVLAQKTKEADTAIARGRKAQIAWEAAKEELEAEILRLKRLPADFDRFLDTPAPDGTTMRRLYELSAPANQAKRSTRVQSVIQRHSSMPGIREPLEHGGPSLG